MPPFITIAQLCSASQQALTPTAAGWHRTRYPTEVVDFARPSEAEVLAYLAGRRGQRVGTAIQVPMVPQHYQRPQGLRRWSVLAMLVATLALQKIGDLAAMPQVATRHFVPSKSFISSVNQQEQVEIEGRIQDASSRQNLADASVLLNGTNFSTSSKADGSFQLLVPEESLKSGFFTLTIIAAGYKSQEVKVAVAAGIPRIDVLLRRKR